MKNNIMTADGIADWSVISELYNIEQHATTRMCPRLTINHITPNNFAKMRVNYAVQVLSRSVSSAIRSISNLDKFSQKNKEHAESTANFIEKMDKLFDIMNSSHVDYKDKYKAPLSKSNTVQKEFLSQMLDYLNNINVVQKINERKKTVYAFDGLKQNINGFLQLSESIFTNDSFDISFILTFKFNQDGLENFFSLIRNSGGNNNKPSVREFNNQYRKIVNMKMITPELVSNYANSSFAVEEDLNEELESLKQILAEEIITDVDENAPELLAAIPDSPMEKIDFTETDEIDLSYLQSIFELEDSELPEKIQIEDLSISYFIGYVSHKILNKIKCDNCIQTLTKTRYMQLPRDYLINYKQFTETNGGLKYPSNEYFEVSRLQIINFSKTFKNKFHYRNIKSMYFKESIEIANHFFPEWYSDNNPCKDHRLKVLDFLLLVLIRKNCMWLVDQQKKYNDKQKILNS